MKRQLISVAIAFAAVATAAPAAAQNMTSAESASAMHRFSGCVARVASDRARALLAMTPGTEEYGRTADRLARGTATCLGSGRLEFSGILFSGGLAEGLLKVPGTPDIEGRLVEAAAAPPIAARDEVERMALCTVRQQPQPVASLLEAPLRSSRETNTLRALTPALQSCLANGQQMRLNASGIRAVLALAAYRLVQPAAAGASGS